MSSILVVFILSIFASKIRPIGLVVLAWIGLSLLSPTALVGQTPGEIFEPATVATNMDPNGDGWVTSTGVAFTPTLNDEISEFEIPFIVMPQVEPEPTDDPLTGAECSPIEIVDFETGSGGSYYYYDDNGTPAESDDLLIFRLRIARNPNGAFGYSFLIDTDLKFGDPMDDPVNGDPNYIDGNPGFEVEVILGSGNTGTVDVVNVDGTDNGTVIDSYSNDTHHQRSYALITDEECDSNDPIFMDFYVPFSDLAALGMTTSSPFRMAAATSSSSSSALGGSASDVDGIDGDDIDIEDQFQMVIDNFPPTNWDGSTFDSESIYSVAPSQNVDSYTINQSLATVIDGDGAIVSAVLDNGTTLPDGTSLNATTGAITVSDPSMLLAGTYAFDITTVDANGGTTTQTVTLVFNPDIEATYTAAPAQNVDSYTLNQNLATVADADGTVASAVLANGTSLPAGTSLNATTGVITVSDQSMLLAGTYAFDITTVDANGGTTTQTVTLVFNPDIEATYVVAPDQNVDSYTSNQNLATVTDADGTIASAVLANGTTLPVGTSLNATTGALTISDPGLLVAGTYNFDITTIDASGGNTTQPVTLVFNADTESVYASAPAQNVDSFTTNQSLATVSDGDGAITNAALANGTSLPAGTSLDVTTGAITVNDPSILVAGTYNFDISTLDGTGGTTTQNVSLVFNADAESSYAVEPAQNADSYSINQSLAIVTDTDGNITGAVLANGTSLPAGTALNATTGEIIVSDPSVLAAGTFNFDITTTDATGGITTQSVNLVFNTDIESEYDVEPGENVDGYTVNQSLATVSDADGAIATAVLANGTSLPNGTTLNSSTGEIIASDPSVLIAGTYNFDITTTDVTGGTTTQAVALVFNADTESAYTTAPAQNEDSYIANQSLATVTDVNGPVASALLANGSSLPTGSSLNAITGEIIVDDPSQLVAGTYNLDITTIDATGGVTTQTITLVFDADTESTYGVAPPENIDSYVGTQSLATVSDTDGTITNAVLANGTSLPAGTSMDATTGEIAVSDPGLLVGGNYIFDVTTIDADGGSTTQTVNLVFTADAEATYTSAAAQNVDSYVTNQSLATVTDADGSVTNALLVNGTSLPAGISLNASTGEVFISDSSQLVASTYNFDVTTEDFTGGTTTQTVTISFISDIEAVYTIEPSGNIDSYNNGDPIASVADGDGLVVSAALVGGTTLSNGISMDPGTGAISVTDESQLVAGIYSVQVQTTDATGGETTQLVQFAIAADNPANYVIQPAQNVDSYIANQSLATVTDADGPISSATLANGTSLPTGTALDPATGEISVSDPSLLVAGTYSLDVTTSDNTGGVTTQTITLVFNLDTESVYAPAPPQNVDSYVSFQSIASLTDANGSIVSAALANGTSLPAGTALDPATGEITVSDPGLLLPGTYTFDLATTDNTGGLTTQTVALTFNPDSESVYTVATAQNVDSYVGNQSLATVADTDGVIVSAVLSNSTSLPLGTSLNASTGEISVSDPAQLVAGNYNFDVSTLDNTGGITTQTITIRFLPDTEAIYTVAPAENVDSYSAGQSLATVVDADGAIASAVLTNGTSLPLGTALNAITGEITVNDPTLLVAGTYTFDITVVDNSGGITTQTVTVTTGPDAESAYTVAPAQNVDSYNINQSLATVADADGGIVNAALANGTSLPAGTALNATTGEVIVSDTGQLLPGSHSFDITTTDNTGGLTTQILVITFIADTESIYTVEPAANVDSYSLNQIIATVVDADGAITNAAMANATSLPAGTALDLATGEITVSDPSLLIAGTYSFDIMTTDILAGITTQTVVLTFNPDTESVYTTTTAKNVDSYVINQNLATVTDADGTVISALLANATSLPGGTSLNAVTGQITVIDPSLLVAGTYSFDIETADNLGGQTIQTISLTFTPDTEAVFTIEPSKNIDSYADGTLIASVSDSDGTIVSATLDGGTSLPPGITLDPNNGSITVVNANLLAAGIYTVQIKTTDITGGVTVQTVQFAIDSDNPAVYTIQPAQNVDSYTNNQSLATVTDADGDIIGATLANGTSVPTGTVLDPTTGEIKVSDANQMVPGIYSFDVNTTDITGGETTQSLAVTFIADTEAVYTVAPSQNIDSYEMGEHLATVFDNDGAINSAINIANLPAGITINNTTGEITISDPDQLVSGTYPIDVMTTDNSGGETTQTITIVIAPDIEAVYSVIPPQNVDGYTTNQILATVSDADGSVISATLANGSSLPDGASLNTSNGSIVVSNPSLLQAGDYSFDIITVDSQGGITEQVIILSFALDQEAVYSVNPAKTIPEYNQAEILATIMDADGAIVSAQLTDGSVLPSGVTLNTTNGDLSVSSVSNLMPGTYTLTILTTDVVGGKTKQTIMVIILNAPPQTDPDAVSVNEDESIIANVLTNDSDPDGDDLLVTRTPMTLPANGTVALSSNGDFTYTPNNNFNGTDFFIYEVCDDADPKNCVEERVNLTVTPVNDPPVTADDSAETNQETELSVALPGVIENDTDVDGDMLIVQAAVDAVTTQGGTITLNADGSYVYTPPSNYIGTDSYEYTVCDDAAAPLCATGILTVLINSTNLPPQPGEDSNTVKELEELIVSDPASGLLQNDTDPNGHLLSVVSVTDATTDGGGRITINADGTYAYVPRLGFVGADKYVYTVCDDDPLLQMCAEGTLNILVEEIPLVFHSGFSPIESDFWRIIGIEKFPDNKVQIFNRWGNVVFEIKGYDNRSKVWRGESTRNGILGGDNVPDGSYFYLVNLGNGTKPLSGYVVLMR